MKVPKLLTLDDAVKVAVLHFGADPELAEQEFEQKTYCPADDVYGAGYYEGFQHAIDVLKKESE